MSITDLSARRARRDAAAGPVEATIDRDTTPGEFAAFTLDAGDSTVIRGPYSPASADPPPMAGDGALVFQSSAGNYWVLGWWPA